eukprot:CAMPEP_0170257424 /NCGR_PEP_ID=MMETSP0116_2-20130129/28569_1 /TAXON_ID=400756 /ORGANISM="Durinskia baltica, Strain CSIRO CS-38" /LENGTH=205 /DNA_ID=CAMNT_0010508441 /DNA_START=20 /DNA_END=633 /DNA_ORIENTATION=+
MAASSSSSALGQAWMPTEANITNVRGEVLLSNEEYPLFLRMLPPGWRLMEVTGFGDDSASDGETAATGRGLVGRGRGRGAGRGGAAAAPADPALGPRRSARQAASAAARHSPGEPDQVGKRRRRSSASEGKQAKAVAAASSSAAPASDGSVDEPLLRQRIERGVDQLNQEQLDKLIFFLEPDLTDEKGDGTDFALDIDGLPLPRR